MITIRLNLEFPIIFKEINSTKTDPQRQQGIVKSIDMESNFEKGKMFGIYDRLFTQIYFANKETGEYINVKKAVVGASCSLITRKEKVESVFGYALNDQDVSLGYDMITDGINLWVSSWRRQKPLR
jgi:hypothetical protein